MGNKTERRVLSTGDVLVFTAALASMIFVGRDQLHRMVAVEVEIAGHDEHSHARLGKVWFEHLVPDKADRKLAVERALLLRGVLMLTAFSHYHDTPLLEMMTRFSAVDPGKSAPEPA